MAEVASNGNTGDTTGAIDKVVAAKAAAAQFNAVIAEYTTDKMSPIDALKRNTPAGGS
jgi:hypothetical protein